MQDRVKGPAIGMIVVASLGILLALAGLVMQGSMLEIYRKMGIPEDQLHQMESMMTANWIVQAFFSLIGIAGAAFVIYGAMQMMKLKSWTLAVVASFLVMIPCFTSCCCVIGLPIGIWSLILLFKPEVKAAFAPTSTP